MLEEPGETSFIRRVYRLITVIMPERASIPPMNIKIKDRIEAKDPRVVDGGCWE
jgi:hypothetical protein